MRIGLGAEQINNGTSNGKEAGLFTPLFLGEIGWHGNNTPLNPGLGYLYTLQMRIYGQRLGKHIHELFASIIEGINLKLPAVADNLKGRIQEGNIPPTVPSRIFVSAGKNGAFMPIDACEGDI
jgi:hypothetical protein